MTLLSTSPKSHTVLRTEQLRPAAINVAFVKQDDSPVDLTGCTLRITVAQLPYRGGAVLHTQMATAVDLVLGLMRFDIQGDDLEFVAGTYPFAMTLVSAEGFQTTVVKGEIDHQANPDSAVPPDYTTVAPPLGLTVALLDNNRITVKVNHHPDSVLMAFAQAADDAYQGAQVASQSAAASAVSAAASAEAAEAIVIADFGTVLDATFPDKVVSPFQPIREALDDIYAPEYITGLVEGGYLDQVALDAAYADQATETTVSTGRLAVANLVASAKGIDSFTTAARDALTGAALWDGRVIYNTTTDRINRYDTGAPAWREIADMQDLATLLTSSGLPATSPAPVGVRGVSNFAARADHVHPGPLWTNIAAFSMPNVPMTVNYAKMQRVGDSVHVNAMVTLTGSILGPVLIDFPTGHAPAADMLYNEGHMVGRCRAIRSGVAWYTGDICPVFYASVNRLGIYLDNGSGAQWTVGTPATFTTGDRMGVDFFYQAAPL